MARCEPLNLRVIDYLARERLRIAADTAVLHMKEDFASVKRRVPQESNSRVSLVPVAAAVRLYRQPSGSPQ